MNRCSFSGLTYSGGYSKDPLNMRFTISSIERLYPIIKILKDVKIYGEDYERLLFEKGNNVFIYLDPPYYTSTKNKLYGKKGCLHTTFDHVRFAENMRNCNHKWLITYDDCVEIRKLYKFAHIKEFQLQYGMNNVKHNHINKNKEIFISNYILESI
jgi:DNA adenine methylase